MPGSLEGIRVLDFTSFVQGSASLVLAEMGADVIKVEDRSHGDPARSIFIIDRIDMSAMFYIFNRGKRSLAVDFANTEASELLWRLIERSDVIVHNHRPGVMERLGLGYDQVRERNPRIVYAAGSGWGSRGPRKDRPALDLAGQAGSGIMSVTGDPNGSAMPAGIFLADNECSVQLTIGILSALFHRERTGQGQKIETSLLGATIRAQAFEMGAYLVSGYLPQRAGTGHSVAGDNPLWNTYRTADGFIAIALFRPDKWPDLCRLLGIPHVASDPRYATVDAVRDHPKEVRAFLDEAFSKKTSAEWEEALAELKQPISPVASYAEIQDDAQVLANEYVVEIDNPRAGQIKMVGHPIQFTETPACVSGAAPELGQHNEELLLELGYNWEDIEGLRQKEII